MTTAERRGPPGEKTKSMYHGLLIIITDSLSAQCLPTSVMHEFIQVKDLVFILMLSMHLLMFWSRLH